MKLNDRPKSSPTHPDAAETQDAHRKSLEQLAAQGFCTYGQYPWDEWERMAWLRGVPEPLASLGRAVMREAHQHGWCERFQSLCGWNDDGRRMIAIALRSPKTARERWDWLLETDGHRVDPTTYQWIGEDAWGWPERRRQWLKKQRG